MYGKWGEVMSKYKVQCRCCGMMMVPKSILSRGIPAGWGMYLGGGKPIGSYCPFCLSEGWDGVKIPVEKTPSEKVVLLCKVVFVLLFANGILKAALEMFVPDDPSAFVFTAAEWSLVFIGIAIYQRYKYKSQ